MRPNVDITHQLNGRVKDIAEANDWTVPEAYEYIIRSGVSMIEAQAESQSSGNSHSQKDLEIPITEHNQDIDSKIPADKLELDNNSPSNKETETK